jgi:hypothetical protein
MLLLKSGPGAGNDLGGPEPTVLLLMGLRLRSLGGTSTPKESLSIGGLLNTLRRDSRHVSGEYRQQ